MMDAGGQVGDNVAMTIARGGGTSFVAGRARSEAAAQLKTTSLTPGQIVYPSEDIRSFYWRIISVPELIKFEGHFEGASAVFFVNPKTGTVVVTDLEGNYRYGVSLMDDALADLLETGVM